MSIFVETYRITFPREKNTKVATKHKEQNVEELLNLVRKQEALNLIPLFENTWSVKFKGSVTRIFSDEKAYALEINPEIFDMLKEDEKAFILLREIEKMRLGLVEPLKAPELTSQQEVELDDHAGRIVGYNVARITLNKLVYYAAKAIYDLRPRRSAMVRSSGQVNQNLPGWVTEDNMNLNKYMGALTDIMRDTVSEAVDKFYFNDRLKASNVKAGYLPVKLDPTFYRGFYVGEMSYTDEPVA